MLDSCVAELRYRPQARSVCAQCRKARQRATLMATCVSPQPTACRPSCDTESLSTPHSLPPHTTPVPRSFCEHKQPYY